MHLHFVCAFICVHVYILRVYIKEQNCCIFFGISQLLYLVAVALQLSLFPCQCWFLFLLFLNFFTLFLYFLEVVRKISFNCSFIAIGVYFLRWIFSLFLFGKVLKMNINQRFLFFVFLVNFTFVFISYHWGLFIFCFSANTC